MSETGCSFQMVSSEWTPRLVLVESLAPPELRTHPGMSELEQKIDIGLNGGRDLLYRAGDVLFPEELGWVNLSRPFVIRIDEEEGALPDVQPGTGVAVALKGHVVEIVLLDACATLDLDNVPLILSEG